MKLLLYQWVLGAVLSVMLISCGRDTPAERTPEARSPKETPMQLTEEQWKQRLTPQQYEVLRRKGTERPFTGKYTTHFQDGVYKCAACGAAIFNSRDKFESHCGWPAFSAPSNPDSVVESRDTSHGMIRTEITCGNCGSHLGHVFEDGPAPTGLRYCINSISMEFEGKNKTE